MLNHPNIVHLDEVLETGNWWILSLIIKKFYKDNSIFFVMEFCGGGSLSEHVSMKVHILIIKKFLIYFKACTWSYCIILFYSSSEWYKILSFYGN